MSDINPNDADKENQGVVETGEGEGDEDGEDDDSIDVEQLDEYREMIEQLGNFPVSPFMFFDFRVFSCSLPFPEF